MLIAGYVFLGVGAAVSCFTAFRWIGTDKRRSLAFSLIAGVACGLSSCLNLSIRFSGIACFLFLAVFIPIVLEPKGVSVFVFPGHAACDWLSGCICYLRQACGRVPGRGVAGVCGRTECGFG